MPLSLTFYYSHSQTLSQTVTYIQLHTHMYTHSLSLSLSLSLSHTLPLITLTHYSHLSSHIYTPYSHRLGSVGLVVSELRTSEGEEQRLDSRMLQVMLLHYSAYEVCWRWFDGIMRETLYVCVWERERQGICFCMRDGGRQSIATFTQLIHLIRHTHSHYSLTSSHSIWRTRH